MAETTEEEFPLPKAFEKLLVDLEEERRTFLRSAPETLADQKRFALWLGNTLLGRLAESVRLLARGMTEAHLLGLATQSDQARLRVYVFGKLRELGAEIDPEAYQGMFPDDAVRSLNDSFAALATYLAKTYPNDDHLAGLFNAVQAAILNLLGATLEEEESAAEGNGEDKEKGPG